MASTWKPGPVAWGVVGFYLLLAVEITSLLQRRMPRRWWRRVHLMSFPLYVVATIHLLAAGTDRHNVVLRWAPVLVSTLIVFLTFVSVLASMGKSARTEERIRQLRPTRAAS
jgi:DMSO/TMAO reductase YedYZ heme-binding membrane subunit